MSKLYTCFFLILMMVTMPVMAAFNHCLGNGLDSGQTGMIMDSPSFESSDKTIDSPLLKHSNKNMQLCHATLHCSFHLCNTHHFFSNDNLYSMVVTALYFRSENTLLSSSIYSPEFRPPIS